MYKRHALPLFVLIVLLLCSEQRDTEEVLKTLASSLFLIASGFVLLGSAAFRLTVLVASLPFVVVLHISSSGPTESDKYKDKVILILGASSGIGKDIALNAAMKGGNLILAARRLNKLEAVAEECRTLGASKVDVIQVDVSIEEQTQNCMEMVNKMYNRLDVLILNAAIPGPWAQVEDIKDNSMLYDLMSINYWGYVVPTLQALPLLRRSPQAHIIVVSSMYGHVISPYQSGYAAAKHALHGFFDNLRQELTSAGIRITIHCPGGIATEVLSKFQTGDNTVKKFYIPNFFLGDSGSCARDILNAYERGTSKAFYPAYAGGFTHFRDIFPEVFDYMFHWITHFYTESGIFYFE